MVSSGWSRDVTHPVQGRQHHLCPGGVALVLGAGNQGFLTVVDMLQCLFVDQEVVLVKHHQLRNYQDKIITKIFAPLIDQGFVATVLHTTMEAAEQLSSNKVFTHIHMTGGKSTHDAILWGSPRGERKIDAKMTSELGCVTPWIILPAFFSDTELQHQAAHLATVIVANNSCNCNAPKAVLMSSKWDQREKFIHLVKSALRQMPAGVPYYPGTIQRYEAFKKEYPDADVIQPNNDVAPHKRCSSAQCAEQDTPFLCIDIEMDADGVSPSGEKCNVYCLQNEAFAPVLAFVTVTPRISVDKAAFHEGQKEVVDISADRSIRISERCS